MAFAFSTAAAAGAFGAASTSAFGAPAQVCPVTPTSALQNKQADTHTHTHTHTLSLSLSLSLPTYLSVSLFLSFPLPLPLPFSLSLSLSFSLSLFLSLLADSRLLHTPLLSQSAAISIWRIWGTVGAGLWGDKCVCIRSSSCHTLWGSERPRPRIRRSTCCLSLWTGFRLGFRGNSWGIWGSCGCAFWGWRGYVWGRRGRRCAHALGSKEIKLGREGQGQGQGQEVMRGPRLHKVMPLRSCAGPPVAGHGLCGPSCVA